MKTNNLCTKITILKGDPMKHVMSTLSIALLLSSPAVLEAGKNKKKKNGAHSIVVPAASTSKYSQELLNDIRNHPRVINIAALTEIDERIEGKRSYKLDFLQERKEVAQKTFNDANRDLAALKKLALLTNAKIETAHNNQQQASLDICNLTAKIKALQRAPNEEVTIQPIFDQIKITEDYVSIQPVPDSFNLDILFKSSDDSELQEFIVAETTSSNNNNLVASSSSSNNNNNNNNNAPTVPAAAAYNGGWLGWIWGSK
jgi:hypothetical protein